MRETAGVSSPTAILDVNTLLAKAQEIYSYIARERMVGLPADMGFEKGGEEAVEIALPDGTIMKMCPESYASFILFPMLTSLVNGRIVMLGDPGLGKTQIATLMGQMTGLPLPAIRAGMVNGHPQLTMADLFGNLDLAEYAKGNISPVWRDIVKSRFRFVNEFNRIPTKTQSGLLAALAEQFVELFNSTFEMKDAPWFFTANEANGGGTYQVIAALWDRMDASVRATPVNAHYLEKARGIDNRADFPEHLRLSEEETKVINKRIEGLPVDKAAEERLTYFFSQLNACEKAAEDVNHRFKSHIVEGEKRGDALWSGAHDDANEYIGAQIENTVGTRIYFSIIRYAKALAWFRGKEQVETEDIAAVLPAVMSHRIKPNRSAQAEDRWAWVSKLWQKAMDRYDERERNTDRLSLARLKEELGTIPLSDQPARIEQYMKEFTAQMDGSAGIEELLSMKLLYEETMRKVKEQGITLIARPRPPRPPRHRGKAGGTILTPEEVLAMHQAGRMPAIGSWVRIPGMDLLVSPHTVTNKEIGKWMKKGGYKRDEGWSEAGGKWREEEKIVRPAYWDVPRFNQPEQPVVGFSWYEAEAYLGSKGLMFLTEAQWEEVARGGLRGKTYPWGDEEPTAELAHFEQPGNTGAPLNVTQLFRPNNYGVFHMAGNVWQWCQDCHDSNKNTKVLRGGSWSRAAVLLRVAYRGYYAPDGRFNGIGCRAARTP